MKKITITKQTWSTFLTVASLIIIAFVFWALSGCKTCEPAQTIEKIVYKDKIVNIPVAYTDSSIIDYVFECDSLYNVIVREKNYYAGQCVTLQDKLQDNKLTVKSYVYIRDTVQIITTDTIKEKQSTIVKKELTKGQQRKITLFWCLLVADVMLFLALLVWLWIRIKNKLKNIFK